MSLDAVPPDWNASAQSLAAAVSVLYMGLGSTLPPVAESGLGGKLVYAGDVSGSGRALLFAANIAGAASLAASADQALLRGAVRDGAADFLVTSLEEALRILKNEVRKRQPVSVVVAQEPAKLTAQMLERGVMPDVLPPSGWNENEIGMDVDQARVFRTQGARRMVDGVMPGRRYVTWAADRNAALWLPRLDACAVQVIGTDDLLRQRWLRFAPRYLGRPAQREHGVALTPAECEQLCSAFRRLLAEHPDSAALLLDGKPV